MAALNAKDKSTLSFMLLYVAVMAVIGAGCLILLVGLMTWG
jgi:hypothetical protein